MAAFWGVKGKPSDICVQNAEVQYFDAKLIDAKLKKYKHKQLCDLDLCFNEKCRSQNVCFLRAMKSRPFNFPRTQGC